MPKQLKRSIWDTCFRYYLKHWDIGCLTTIIVSSILNTRSQIGTFCNRKRDIGYKSTSLIRAEFSGPKPALISDFYLKKKVTDISKFVVHFSEKGEDTKHLQTVPLIIWYPTIAQPSLELDIHGRTLSNGIAVSFNHTRLLAVVNNAVLDWDPDDNEYLATWRLPFQRPVSGAVAMVDKSLFGENCFDPLPLI